MQHALVLGTGFIFISSLLVVFGHHKQRQNDILNHQVWPAVLSCAAFLLGSLGFSISGSSGSPHAWGIGLIAFFVPTGIVVVRESIRNLKT